MSSKYDNYWENKLDKISQLIGEAYKIRASDELDVSDIQGCGKRNSWYGIVEVHKDGIRKGEMAHAMSLGKIILHNALLDSFGDVRFRFVISKYLKLKVERLDFEAEMVLSPIKHIQENSPSISYKEDVGVNVTVEEGLVEAFAEIPWGVWENIVRQEPEWRYMEPYMKVFGFGPFGVLLVATSLNDFQTKGTAEVGYWPPIQKFLERSPIPLSLNDLYNLLEPFYQRERLSDLKIKRLSKFFDSSLASILWKSSPQKVSMNFLDIWKTLANTMGQKPEDKTISFAMKCLGISLLMAGEYKFDFTAIPIPLDSRVMEFTEKVGYRVKGFPRLVRAFWNEVLSKLQETHHKLTMIHLDSLIWQIGTMKDTELKKYFEKLGIQSVGERLCTLLKEVNMDEKSETIIASKPDWKEKKILILFPCSGEKQKQYAVLKGTFKSGEEKRAIDFLENTRDYLINGRNGLTKCIDKNSIPIAALDRYEGSLYSITNFKETIKQACYSSNVHFLIMSGAYGILTPSEKIHYYEKPINAKYWKQFKLPEVIEEYIKRNKITHVYGFFSQTTDYMKIIRSINWQNLKNTTGLKTARTYYINFQGHGGAQVIVPKITGQLIIAFIKCNYDQENFYVNPFSGQDVEFIDHV